MDQVSQENELQKAIDDITKNGGAQDDNADVAAGLEEQIQNQMGTPPVPPMPPAGDGPAEAMPPADVAPVEGAPVDGVAPAEVPVDAPVSAPIDQPPIDTPVDAPAPEGMPAPAAPEIPAAPDAIAPEAPVADPALSDAALPELNDTGSNDIATVKEDMLRDLFPIMDQVDMGAEEKYELYKTMLDTNNDKSLIAAAYGVVKGIADERQRAEALLYLIKKADS